MDTKRRSWKNNFNNQIKDAHSFIERSETTISRLKNSTFSNSYIKSQIIIINTAIQNKKEQLILFHENLEKLKKGLLDEQIQNEYSQNKIRNDTIAGEKQQKRIIKQKEKQKTKNTSRKYWKGIITASRAHRAKDREIRSSFRYFNRVIDSLPSYMAKNLAGMPNNKGYIWRSVRFFGLLPTRKGPKVLFEKKKGRILVIHEYYPYEYRRYEKVGKERKKLTQKRKLKYNQKRIGHIYF